ncbi:hypothetical protein HK413_03635 [Mucilaginibacter sp. S1162]|uniref:Phage protein n=1 Tax=Mucilaginibacter humi TaxID=2732510 RepID=A0ABX1VZU3_9SPHI|nr:hypothetical protein [Mucilaginibacter humi]NNU33476.1 hypothetical protein [Mucilaginibacter humi]
MWKVKVNGKAAMLYKLGSEWMQRNEDYRDMYTLKAIGEFIDTMITPPVVNNNWLNNFVI